MDAPQRLDTRRNRELHIVITDTESGQRKVDLRLPVNLAAVALRTGARLLPPGDHAADLLAALQDGTALDLDVMDAHNCERFVISVH